MKGKNNFYFLGNSQHNQFPREIGNSFSRKVITGRKFDFSDFDLKHDDILDYFVNYDTTCFKTKNEFIVFGG